MPFRFKPIDRSASSIICFSATALPGVVELVPAYTSVLVDFDPLSTDHRRIEAGIRELLAGSVPDLAAGVARDVQVCYEGDLAPDLDRVATQCGLSREAAIAMHLSGDYQVFMVGFAPGYAYLGGVPSALQLPRKPTPVRDIAAGSVIIAGPQCLVTTFIMPTGWWIIGRSPTTIINPADEQPFLFEIGDTVCFSRIDRDTFDTAMAKRPVA